MNIINNGNMTILYVGTQQVILKNDKQEEKPTFPARIMLAEKYNSTKQIAKAFKLNGIAGITATMIYDYLEYKGYATRVFYRDGKCGGVHATTLLKKRDYQLREGKGREYMSIYLSKEFVQHKLYNNGNIYEFLEYASRGADNRLQFENRKQKKLFEC